MRGSESHCTGKKPDVPPNRSQPKELHSSLKRDANLTNILDYEDAYEPSLPSNMRNPQATAYTREISATRSYHQNRMRNIEVEFRGRSQSPSSSSSSSTQSTDSGVDADQHEEEYDDGMNVDKMEHISAVVDKCCSALAESTQSLIAKIVDAAQKEITAFGFCLSQLWMFCPKGGLSSQKEDSTYVSISPNKTEDILHSVFSPNSIKLDVRKEMQNCESEGTCFGLVSPGDAHWEYLTTLILSKCRTSDNAGTAGAGNKEWGSIYLIPISAVSEYSAFSNRKNCEGFIMAVKSVPEAEASSRIRTGISNVSRSKVHTAMSLLWYKQLASAIYLKLKAVKGSARGSVRGSVRGSARGSVGGSLQDPIYPDFDLTSTEALNGLNQKENNSTSLLDNSEERSSIAFELAVFCSKCSGIATLEGLGSLVDDLLPRVLRCSKVTLLMLESNNTEKGREEEQGEGEGEGEACFYPVSGSIDDRFMNRTTLDQLSRVDSFLESPSLRHSHVMLSKPNTNVPYGALLIVRDTSQDGMGPGSGTGSGSSLSDADARVSLMEIINTSIRSKYDTHAVSHGMVLQYCVTCAVDVIKWVKFIFFT